MVLTLALVAGGAGALYLRPSADTARPARAGFAPTSRCTGCHPDEAARWRGSPHDLAMAKPTPETVQGDFREVVFEDTRLSHSGPDWSFEIRAADGSVERHRVEYTFGTAPLQQYLLKLPGGRLQASALAWDTSKGRWFRVQDPALHYTSRYQTWNTMCAECHSTDVDKGYDPDRDAFATTFAEEDVGCQSCHGPGQAHAEDPTRPLPARTDVEACAPCHARRAPLTAKATPGEPFDDHFRVMTLQPPLYFPDGQIRDEVFEYGSFTQSLMYARGVVCVDCHDAHRASKAADNSTCTRCHGAEPPLERFPTLAARARDLDRPEHHHHTPGSPGAQCVACHMPARTYMGVDVRHDHRLAVPRPDLSAKLGTPDACTNACHRDHDPAWAAATVAAWFPRAEPRPEHFGEVLARAQHGMAHPRELAQVVRGDAPDIARATALEHLLADPEACLALEASADPSPLVRSVAAGCAEGRPPAERAALTAWALSDPRRVVRLEGAWVITGAQSFLRSPEDLARYRAARAELNAMYEAQRDRPEGAFNLALLAEAEGRWAAAAAHYAEALRLDPEYTPARANLAALARR